MKTQDFQVDEDGYCGEPRYLEFLLGQLIQALISDHKEETAAILLVCSLEWRWDQGSLDFWIRGPMAVIKALRETANLDPLEDYLCEDPSLTIDYTHRDLIHNMLSFMMPVQTSISHCYLKLELEDLPEKWREQLLQVIETNGTTNQALVLKELKRNTFDYENLLYGSASEVMIAKALERRQVMYFPNCAGRVTEGQLRNTRYPDFLIFYKGKWGMLEVDGEPFHTGNAARDHDRSRVFKLHGIAIVEHYPATRCYQDPQAVVAEFLQLLVSV